jgi:hypothetical protein
MDPSIIFSSRLDSVVSRTLKFKQMEIIDSTLLTVMKHVLMTSSKYKRLITQCMN